MTNRPFVPPDVDSEVRSILGEKASDWMNSPNRLFDHMTPSELARSPEGARVVLAELRRPSASEIAKARTSGKSA